MSEDRPLLRVRDAGVVPCVEVARVRLVLAVHALGPPVCTAADGAVEHASLGVARRAVVDDLHVVEVVAHAPALILPGGTPG